MSHLAVDARAAVRAPRARPVRGHGGHKIRGLFRHLVEDQLRALARRNARMRAVVVYAVTNNLSNASLVIKLGTGCMGCVRTRHVVRVRFNRRHVLRQA